MTNNENQPDNPNEDPSREDGGAPEQDDSVPAQQAAPPAPVTFQELNLHPDILKGIRAQGFEHATPIQAQVIPPALAGRDILGSAQTGSGKTAAFILPVLHHLTGARGFRCLVLEPTRELAIQVKDVAEALGKFTGLQTAAVFGGVESGPQGKKIRDGADIIVATPGRLIDFAWTGVVDFKNISHFVVDEVDRMFDMGFIDDIQQIISYLPRAPFQKMGFSATMPPEVMRVLDPLLNDPVKITIGERTSRPAEGITHELYPVQRRNKTELLIRLLKQRDMDSAIIFTETKYAAEQLFKELDKRHFSVLPFHSGYDQVKRYDMLRRFREGRVKMLVATNVAARGLDITGISHIFNYEVPQSAEDYVHRIGRSARANATGTAITLADPSEARYIQKIERLIQMPLPRKQVEGLTLADLAAGGGGRGPGPRGGGGRGGGPRGGFRGGGKPKPGGGPGGPRRGGGRGGQRGG
jgi:ATP-dependent RNA helicase RhlE